MSYNTKEVNELWVYTFKHVFENKRGYGVKELTELSIKSANEAVKAFINLSIQL